MILVCYSEYNLILYKIIYTSCEDFVNAMASNGKTQVRSQDFIVNAIPLSGKLSH